MEDGQTMLGGHPTGAAEHPTGSSGPRTGGSEYPTGGSEYPTGVSAVSWSDIESLEEQLGRPARGVVGIAARCVCGRPIVVRTAPRLDDGTPFPTTFYLTCPAAVAAIGTLEASGVMKAMSERLVHDAALASAYLRAHEHFLAERAKLGVVEEIAGVSAGGMPTRVKCLHVLVAHSLAAGPGVNPFGDEALALIRDTWRPERCSC